MDDSTNRQNLDLVRKDNPEYFDLIDQSNEIVDAFNFLDRKIQEFPIVRLFPFFQRRMIKELMAECKEMDDHIGEWANEAKKFLINPRITTPHDDIRHLRFLHHTGIFRDRIWDMESSLRTLIGNFNQIKGAYINQRNLSLALLGLLFSLVGLGWSIIQSHDNQPQGESTQVETTELTPTDPHGTLSNTYEELLSIERAIDDSASRSDTTSLAKPQKDKK